MSIMRIVGALALLVAGAILAPACGSDARATDTCRTLEAERCKRAAECKLEEFVGDPDSCIRFYDVQCGRGVPDEFKEPSKAELNACIDAIHTSCDAVVDPSKVPACYFVIANTPPPAADTGTAETATDAATEAATDAADEGG